MTSMGNFRDTVGEAMVALGERDSRVVIVSADVMASCRVNRFAERFPERTFNVGIAEQEMISFAAGLAREGAIVYTFAMGPFLSMRACEQIRNDVAYDGLPIRMVGTYAGFSGGISGATHWAMEDCAIMRGLPGIKVWEPSDCRQLQQMIDCSADMPDPIYMRLSIMQARELHGAEYRFEPFVADVIREGDDGAFLCAGICVQYALEASEQIQEETGMEIMVLDMHTVKPIDRNAVRKAAETGHIVVAQDHNIVGGLGDAVASVLAESGLTVNYRVLGIPDRFVPAGHAPWLYHEYQFDADGLKSAMECVLSPDRGGVKTRNSAALQA